MKQARPAVTVVDPTARETRTPLMKPGSQTNATSKATIVVAPTFQQDPRLNDPAFKEQLGRYALSFVGSGDADADEAWVKIINDPSLSANARQNLIEDLNEDGLSDPQNPTAADLPLIASRIMLIEELGPDAMDKVNADAFQEAYKDLVDMYVRLAPQAGR